MKYYATNRYPSLCKYFEKQEDMAKAGCMSTGRLSSCLSGKSNFTPNEEKAICNEILISWGLENDKLSVEEEQLLFKARSGHFDEVFRIETT